MNYKPWWVNEPDSFWAIFPLLDYEYAHDRELFDEDIYYAREQLWAIKMGLA